MLPKPEITELLMTAYMSAEQERTLQFKPDRLETYVPLVAQGLWNRELTYPFSAFSSSSALGNRILFSR